MYPVPLSFVRKAVTLIIAVICIIGQGTVASAVELLNRAAADQNRQVKINPSPQEHSAFAHLSGWQESESLRQGLGFRRQLHSQPGYQGSVR